MGKNKNKKKNTEAATIEPPAEIKEDEEMTEKPTEETPNDGVKLLEEVFGSASVSSSGVSDDSTSNNSATEPEKEAATEEKQDIKVPEAATIIGPLPPADDEFDEEELNKAEEHKN